MSVYLAMHVLMGVVRFGHKKAAKAQLGGPSG